MCWGPPRHPLSTSMLHWVLPLPLELRVQVLAFPNGHSDKWRPNLAHPWYLWSWHCWPTFLTSQKQGLLFLFTHRIYGASPPPTPGLMSFQQKQKSKWQQRMEKVSMNEGFCLLWPGQRSSHFLVQESDQNLHPAERSQKATIPRQIQVCHTPGTCSDVCQWATEHHEAQWPGSDNTSGLLGLPTQPDHYSSCI